MILSLLPLTRAYRLALLRSTGMPKPVCEVAFAEMTDDEQLRQTTFLGWRDDKKPKDVVLERP